MLATRAEPTTRESVWIPSRDGPHGRGHRSSICQPVSLFFPDRYRTLFALTIIPGTIAVLLILLVPRTLTLIPSTQSTLVHQEHPGHQCTVCRTLLRIHDACWTLFALGNSTDGVSPVEADRRRWKCSPASSQLMWAALRVVKAAVSVVGGSWSDRIGRRAVIATGWLIQCRGLCRVC